MSPKASAQVGLAHWRVGGSWRKFTALRRIHPRKSIRKRAWTGWRRWSLLGLLPLLIGAVYQATAAANEIRKYTAPGERVDLGGRRLHLRVMGKGGPAVVLEAAGFGCSVDYASIQSEVAEMTRVCAYDRAGMGWSDPCHQPRSIRELVDDLRALLHRAEIKPPYLLVGASAGGLIVELFARMYPQEVVGLVLIDALDEEALARLPRASIYLMKKVSRGQLCARLGILPLLDPFELKKLPLREGSVRSALTYRSAPWNAARFFLNTLERSEADLRAAPPLNADLPLRVLTHGLTGDLLGPWPDDGLLAEIEPIWREQQAALTRHSSRGKQIIAEKSGHRIIAQQPDLVTGTIRELIQSIRDESI